MDARLKLGLAFWFAMTSWMAARPPYHLHDALPSATDNDSTQADKVRNTLPRVVNLKEVDVLAPRQLTQPTIAQALNEQRLIAGSTSLVQMSPLRQRLSTLKDALAMQPGVIIQEFFGLNDQPRLNIRGSGIQSNPQRRGVYLLQDGIPVNFADGSYIIGVMDPMTAHFVEVFKGANALNFGASTLGGAINFVSPTANKQHGANTLVKVEGGSYGYRAVAASMGYRWQTSDAHISTSYSAQDGHRLYNRNTRWSIAANYGLQNPNGRVENRTYLHFTWLKFQFPGPLNMQQLMDNPKQVNAGVDLPFSMGPNVLRDKPRRFARMLRVANRTGIRINANSDLVAAVYYQYADDQFVFPITISIPHSYHHDGGLTVSYRLNTGKHNLRAGLVASAGQIDRRTYINKDGLESFMFAHDNLQARNLTLFAEDLIRLTSKLNVVADAHLVYNERNSSDRFPQPDLRPWYSHMSKKYRYFRSQSTTLNQHFAAFNPRIGLIYSPFKGEDVQLFGNLSRSYEPPTFDELVGTEVTTNINTSPKRLYAIALDKQTATTLELGSKGRTTRFSWNVAAYRSWVHNEILEVKDYVRGIKRTENYPTTLHQGVEVGLNAVVADNPWGINAGKLTLGGVYNFSDFRFSGGKYQGKRLAGVPQHYLNLSAEYEHSCGLSLAAQVEWKPGETPIDHTNTMFQPAY
ncbi:MAG: TonB-dependent receptor family protein, partial [Prevotella conceptionensis]